MSNVIEVTDSLSKWVNSSERRLVVIDFFATWCGPCRMMHPIFDELSLKYKNVVFIRVDGDRHREISGEYGISGFPTFIFVFHGDEVDRVVGADPQSLESKIQQYATSAQTFTGTGNALGGSSVTSESAREMRLKRFKDVKVSGTHATSNATKLLNRLSNDMDDEEEEIKGTNDKSGDASIKETLLAMGFSESNITKTLQECNSRDIADLVIYISGLSDDHETEAKTEDKAESEAEAKVVCDGNTCHLVPTPKKSLEERINETKLLMQQNKLKKEKEQKEEEKKREKERIEKGKELQIKKEEFEKQQRQREIEKEKREKLMEQQEKKRQLELWRQEHGIPEPEKAKVVEKTPEEKATLLVESIALQRIDGVGATALRTLSAILKNTSKPDAKYRRLRKDNAVVQKRVLSVPGAIPLLNLAGFETTEEGYEMKEKDDQKYANVNFLRTVCFQQNIDQNH